MARAEEQEALAEEQKARAETEERAAEKERRAKRRLAGVLAALALFFALAVGLAILTVNQRKQFALQTAQIAALQASLATPVKRGPEIQGSGGKYIRIPAGTFLMGCSLGDTDCFDRERPTHKVTLTHDFYMGETDVTVGAYRRFVQAANRTMPPTPSFPQTDEHPVVNVSWQDAVDYCKWDGGGRLPTEAEWEYAARAGTSQARYGNLDEIAWYDKNSGGGTHPVKQKQPNAFGLYDMLGNVWQWNADWYDEKYYEKSPAQDPKRAASSEYRSVRGGSWSGTPGVVRVSVRGSYLPGDRDDDLGFRCVREVP
jgi:formylglycine-generating enzyme